jgi:hypothetical protein
MLSLSSGYKAGFRYYESDEIIHIIKECDLKVYGERRKYVL